MFIIYFFFVYVHIGYVQSPTISASIPSLSLSKVCQIQNHTKIASTTHHPRATRPQVILPLDTRPQDSPQNTHLSKSSSASFLYFTFFLSLWRFLCKCRMKLTLWNSCRKTHRICLTLANHTQASSTGRTHYDVHTNDYIRIHPATYVHHNNVQATASI